MKTEMKMPPKTKPSVKGSEEFDAPSAPAKVVRPTAMSSGPKRFSGLLAQARRPPRMKDHALSSSATRTKTGSSSWSLLRTSAAAPPLRRSPRAITPAAFSRRMGLSKHSAKRSARQLALRDEGDCAAGADDRAEVGLVVARGEDDLGPDAVSRTELCGDGEPVLVRELDVEEHEVGLQAPDRLDGRAAVRSLADHLESVGEQQCLDRRTEAGMIVDDQDPLGHVAPMVAKR
jgi:hypothetical protein